METAGDRPLFTPGPLTTSRTVKQAMLRDLGSRDGEFLSIIASVRAALLGFANAPAPAWTCVPMQGSGTFGIESVVSTAIPRDGQLIVACNGAYGRRIATMGKRLAIATSVVECPETQRVDPDAVDKALASAKGRPTLLAVVHCETTTGLVNPVAEVCAVAQRHGVPVLVDSMSGFGALPVDAAAWSGGAQGSHPATGGASWIVSSSNKCIEGVPGLSFVLARVGELALCEARARSLSLDLYDQWRGLETDGQFRFTPPTHVILALDQAIRELAAEGGPAVRLRRYAGVQKIVVEGLRGLGLRTLLPDALLSPIITSFVYPEQDANGRAFNFATFSSALAELGYVIYPGKVSNAPCFRVGSIGRLRESDAAGLVRAVEALIGRSTSR
ncbi:MAG: 2-aminoethylphosphonate--pyruvate transaminase [Planctomycetota bacterium]|nr:2-aminoethylphosphonate--pyruvate transaminase [Planctomycetota bacterium]